MQHKRRRRRNSTESNGEIISGSRFGGGRARIEVRREGRDHERAIFSFFLVFIVGFGSVEIHTRAPFQGCEKRRCNASAEPPSQAVELLVRHDWMNSAGWGIKENPSTVKRGNLGENEEIERVKMVSKDSWWLLFNIYTSRYFDQLPFISISTR